MSDDDDEKDYAEAAARWLGLPQEMRDGIMKMIDDGVSFGLDTAGRRLVTSSIHWHPGSPNKLAEAIIKEVGAEEMPLVLDGHRYLVRKTDE